MPSVNKVILIGHCGKDPDMHGEVCNVSLATSERYKDKAGESHERTEWHRLVFFGKTAEIAGKYLHKGDLTYVEGRIQTQKWQDKEGRDRYSTQIVCDRLKLIGGKPKDEGERVPREEADENVPF